VSPDPNLQTSFSLLLHLADLGNVPIKAGLEAYTSQARGGRAYLSWKLDISALQQDRPLENREKSERREGTGYLSLIFATITEKETNGTKQ
jgi:hypothetical protein